MGKKKTVVSYSISRLLQDQSIFNRVDQGIRDYGLGKSPHSSLADIVKFEAPKRLNKRFDYVNRWAKRTGNYYYGDTVSSYEVRDFQEADSYIRNKLELDYGTTITFKYSLFSDPDLSHMVWAKLIKDYGYDTITNELTSQYQKPLYLKTGIIKYCRPTIDQVTLANKLPKLDVFGLSYEHGATYSRLRDYTLEPIDYTIDETAISDVFHYTSTVRIISTRVLITTTGTGDVVSDDTTYDGLEPSSYDTLVVSTISDTSTTSGGNTTRTIKKNNDYDILNTFTLLEYEYSGVIDESNALTEADTDNLNPTAEDNSSVVDLTPSDYFMVGFTYINNGELTYGYYTYEYGSGTDTTLDNIFNEGNSFGNYMPRIYIRRDGIALNKEDQKDTFRYKSSKRITSKLGLDFDYLCDEIHKAVGSLDKVKQISLATIIAVNDLKPPQVEYFFYWIRSHYNVSAQHTDGDLRIDYPQLRESKYVVLSDNENLNTLSWFATDTGTVTKTIGDVGMFSHTLELPQPVAKGETSYGVHYVYKQVTATECIYYSIWDLVSAERVQGGYYGIVSYFESACCIPLDLSLLVYFSTKEAELLCGQCLYIMVNTSQTIKVKWYQTGIFKAIIFIVAVILALPSGGTSLTLAAFVEAVVVSIFTQIVLNIVITILVKVFNLDAITATILYIVASIASGSTGFNASAVTAESLLISLNHALAAYSVANKLEYALVMQEQAKFAGEASAQQKYLDEAKEQYDFRDYTYSPLYSPTNVSGLIFAKTGDTPTRLFSRIRDSLNVPDLCYSSVSLFHSSMLQLPKP